MKKVTFLLLLFSVSIANAQLTDNGTLSLSHNSSTVGDMISLYGNRFNNTNMYGFGVNNSSLYSKSALKHLWYIGSNHDNGTSAQMELNTSELNIKPNIKSSGTLSLQATQTSVGDIISLYGNRLGNSNMYGIGVENSSALYFKTNGVYRWYVGTNADQGTSAIMKLNSDELVVDGKFRSEEVKVEVINAPDYVFEPTYELRTLQETKEYIAENKHLPEIPSAKVMEANGVELGNMNMRLLKKIEELTLYQIELLERLEKAEQEISQLKNK